jgi:hypothetical protein
MAVDDPKPQRAGAEGRHGLGWAMLIEAVSTCVNRGVSAMDRRCRSGDEVATVGLGRRGRWRIGPETSCRHEIRWRSKGIQAGRSRFDDGGVPLVGGERGSSWRGGAAVTIGDGARKGVGDGRVLNHDAITSASMVL